MFTKLGNISGIYCIKNLIDMKRSVGQAQNLNVRARTHDSVLRSKKIKDSKYLQCAWNFYGEDNFEMYLVEECPIELLNEREEYWIKELHSHFSEWGYNLTWGGDGIRGHKHSSETRKKQSDAKKGKHPWNYGKKATQKAIRNQSIAHFGKHHSLETIQKLRKANKGKNNPMYGKRGKQSPNCGKARKKFSAQIRHMGKRYYLGTFITEEEAAIAYNLKARELYNLDYDINQIK